MDSLGVDMIPYLVLLVVPVMGRMSDQDQSVRLLAAQCFASLIRLMPLEVNQSHCQLRSLTTHLYRKENFTRFFFVVDFLLSHLAEMKACKYDF